MLCGRLGTFDQPMALVGGNCSIQGFDMEVGRTALGRDGRGPRGREGGGRAALPPPHHHTAVVFWDWAQLLACRLCVVRWLTRGGDVC